MIFSNSLSSSAPVLVADASVVINLNATQRASEIIKSVCNPVVITDNAWLEIESGRCCGHDDASRLQELIDSGLVQRCTLDEKATEIYQSLIDGRTAYTLDDGEAATIGYAVEHGGVALIDERKARRLCGDFFPNLKFISTVEILMHDQVLESLGPHGQTDAIINALMGARMRVPPEHVEVIRELIGTDKAQACSSLPKKQ